MNTEVEHLEASLWWGGGGRGKGDQHNWLEEGQKLKPLPRGFYKPAEK